MAAPILRDRLEMECLEGIWETLDGHQRCRFRGTVRITMTSLEHADVPVRTLEGAVEWIQPTPAPFALVEPVHVIEVSSSEEDPEEEPEEEPEEDPEEDPEEEPEAQQPELDVEMLPAPDAVEEQVVELDPVEEIAPESVAESVDESGPGWLVESDDPSSQEYRLEWMASSHTSHYPRSPIAQSPQSVAGVVPSMSSSEFAVVPDVDQPGPSRTARMVMSSDSESEGDPDSPHCPDSPPSQLDQ